MRAIRICTKAFALERLLAKWRFKTLAATKRVHSLPVDRTLIIFLRSIYVMSPFPFHNMAQPAPPVCYYGTGDIAIDNISVCRRARPGASRSTPDFQRSHIDPFTPSSVSFCLPCPSLPFCLEFQHTRARARLRRAQQAAIRGARATAAAMQRTTETRAGGERRRAATAEKRRPAARRLLGEAAVGVPDTVETACVAKGQGRNAAVKAVTREAAAAAAAAAVGSRRMAIAPTPERAILPFLGGRGVARRRETGRAREGACAAAMEEEEEEEGVEGHDEGAAIARKRPKGEGTMGMGRWRLRCPAAGCW